MNFFNLGQKDPGAEQPKDGAAEQPEGYQYNPDVPTMGFLAAIAAETTITVGGEHSETDGQEGGFSGAFVDTAAEKLVEAGYEPVVAQQYATGMVTPEEDWKGGVVPHPTTAAEWILRAHREGDEVMF